MLPYRLAGRGKSHKLRVVQRIELRRKIISTAWHGGTIVEHGLAICLLLIIPTTAQ